VGTEDGSVCRAFGEDAYSAAAITSFFGEVTILSFVILHARLSDEHNVPIE